MISATNAISRFGLSLSGIGRVAFSAGYGTGVLCEGCGTISNCRSRRYVLEATSSSSSASSAWQSLFFAPEHYVAAWQKITDPAGWDKEQIEKRPMVAKYSF